MSDYPFKMVLSFCLEQSDGTWIARGADDAAFDIVVPVPGVGDDVLCPDYERIGHVAWRQFEYADNMVTVTLGIPREYPRERMAGRQSAGGASSNA